MAGKIGIGTTDIGSIYVGTNEIGKVYLGADTNPIYEKAAVTIISFTINNISYQAEDGMTWAEWADSEYDTGGFRYSTLYDAIMFEFNYMVGVVACDYSISGDTTITNNGIYVTFNIGDCS